MQSGDAPKRADFYYRLKKQYEQGNKPITYQLDLESTQPKPRAGKFMVVVKKFISIYKWGLREAYENEQDRRDNYWSELNKHFHDDYEMGFVNQGYWQKPKNKIVKYFAILIYTKKIFDTFDKIVKQMGYLFQNEENKKKNYTDEIKNLLFLKDGQYKVMGQLIAHYDRYVDKKKQEQQEREIQRLEIERKKKQQEQAKLRELKQLEEAKQKEKKAQQEEMKKKAMDLQKKKQQNNKKQEQPKIINNQSYFPEVYKPAFAANMRNYLPKNTSNLNFDEKDRFHDHRMKNSQKLFTQKFKDQFKVFSYSLKPQMSDDKTECNKCHQNLKHGFYFFGGNSNFCYYTGKWYCNNDIHQERMSIPWKATQSFDLRGYTVCKESHAILKAFYQKSIVQINKNNPIIEQNKGLKTFLQVKRQIHLMYDSICNLEIIKEIITKRQNYCLQMNLFSMKNLYDIHNGQQIIRLNRQYEILRKHFYKCGECQKKVGYICPICNSPVKIFPFEIKQTIGCSSCKKLYHKNCLPTCKCKCKEDE